MFATSCYRRTRQGRDRRRGKPGHPCRVADAGCAAKARVEPLGTFSTSKGRVRFGESKRGGVVSIKWTRQQREGGSRQGWLLEITPSHPIGARDEEDRKIERDYQGQQTQGQVEGEAPPPESAGHRMNQAGRALRWRLLRTREPGVDIITGASLARPTVNLSPADRQNPAPPMSMVPATS
jgi:hypothetical protein